MSRETRIGARLLAVALATAIATLTLLVVPAHSRAAVSAQAASTTTLVVLNSPYPTVGGTIEGMGMYLQSTVSGGSGTPTGSVQLFLGSNAFGSPVPLANGKASWLVAIPFYGDYTFHATYSGDGTYSGSTSGTVLLIVVPRDPYARYVDVLYRGLFGRHADSGGLSYWRGLLVTGTPPIYVGDALVNSADYRGGQIASIFESYLHRAPNTSENNYYMFLTGMGWSFDNVRVSVLSTDEFFSSQAGGSNATFVIQLYQQLLGRQPDLGGLFYNVAQLNNGTPRSTVTAAIVYSGERLSNQVISAYQFLLHRAPSLSELFLWVNKLITRALTIQAFLVRILGSGEFWNGITGFPSFGSPTAGVTALAAPAAAPPLPLGATAGGWDLAA